MSGHASMIPRVPFEEAARIAIDDTQLRRNLGKATTTIRAKRGAVGLALFGVAGWMWRRNARPSDREPTSDE